ncbi:ATP-dependent helicase [Nocardia mexicana]|uniref:DNA 3'-5' helicase n=1 Tax=Nocardia mexicana TaxID=279262 RepID=A0A370HA15_9NOCA|nr:ATP-dependent DNA helicase [Nocardia mexicana]RDI53276.1 DNA helicase-2/ATP-dependent DNA helicase PcrA [Nocardia mexicana]
MRITPGQLAEALGLPPPTDEQAAVIAAPPGPTLVVAGAGAGKTETMASRVVWMVANGLVVPDAVLGLTFTRKAAQQLTTRIRTRLARLAGAPLLREIDPGGRLRARLTGSEPEISTYHSYAGRLLGEHGLLLPVEPNATLLTETQLWQLAHRVVTGWDGDLDTDRTPVSVTEAVLALSGQLAEHLVEPEQLAEAHTELEKLILTLPRGPRQRGGPSQELLGILETQHERVALLPLVRRLGDELRRRGALDFGAQMSLAARLAAEHPEVGAAERDRFRLVLLDEYQDTGHAQRILLAALFGDLDSAHGRGTEPAGQLGGGPDGIAEGNAPERVAAEENSSGRGAAELPRERSGDSVGGGSNSVSGEHGGDPQAPGGGRLAVTAVGDPMQSIYGWRGASAANLPRFATDFPSAPGVPAPILPLLTSWRNPPEALELANLVAEPLRHTGVSVDALRPRPDATPGTVALALTETVADERDWVAERIAAEWEARADAGVPPPTSAVLVRRNADAAPLAEALRERGLPVEIVGLGGLLATPEVADVVATLRLIADPGAGSAAMRILTGARWRLGVTDLAALSRRARDLSINKPPDQAAAITDSAGLADALRAVAPEPAERAGLTDAIADPGAAEQYSDTGYQRIVDLGRELAGLRERGGQSLPELVADVERTIGVGVETQARRAAVGGGAGREHLDAFAEVVAGYATDHRASLPGLLAFLAAAEEVENGLEPGEVEVARDRVQVLTVHAAKGLEWEVVAVPHVVRGVFPSGTAAGTWLGALAELPTSLRGDRQRDAVPADSAVVTQAVDHAPPDRSATRAAASGVSDAPSGGRSTASRSTASVPDAVDAESADSSMASCATSAPEASGAAAAGHFSVSPTDSAQTSDGVPVLDLSDLYDRSDLDRAIKQHKEALNRRRLEEERRLFYVALTRTERALFVSAHHWAETGSTPKGPSDFLLDLKGPAERPDSLLTATVRIDHWADPPADDAVNPFTDNPASADWPRDPLGKRRTAVQEGAALVRTAISDGDPAESGGGATEPTGQLSLFDETDSAAADPDADPEGWATDVDALLVEHFAAADRVREVELPGQLPATALVDLRADPAKLAARLRRPLPYPPSPFARRGTAFHAWIQQWFGATRLLGLDELPGAADSGTADADLIRLQEAFLSSPWADRNPVEVEVAFETSLAGTLIRGRMDAVFAEPGGRWLVVDWKTGAAPTRAEEPAVEMQLAVYRLAWARLLAARTGADEHEILEKVGAAFHYVRTGRTIAPPELPGAEALTALIEAAAPAWSAPPDDEPD